MNKVSISFWALFVIALAFVGIGFSNRSSSPITTIDESIPEGIVVRNELRDVQYCGKTIRVNQVFVNGVDVIPQVFLLSEHDRYLCEQFKRLPFDYSTEIKIEVNEECEGYPNHYYCIDTKLAGYIALNSHTLDVYEIGMDGHQYKGTLQQ